MLALASAAIGFAALGVAIGALAREVRAASLLAFLLVVAAGVPGTGPQSGRSPSTCTSTIGAISFVFPFKAALQALDAAVNGARRDRRVDCDLVGGRSLRRWLASARRAE